MKRYYVKQFIKYGALFIILVLATMFVYDKGKATYQKYLDTHKDDDTWIRDNINLVEDMKIGDGVLVPSLPNDLEVSRDIYEEIIMEEIDNLLINSYKMNNPLFIYNPYFNNPTTINIYFHTGNNYKFEYYVTTESIGLEEEIIYTRMSDGYGDMYDNRHIYVLDGLTPGKKNNLLIRILDSNDQVVDAENFILNIPRTQKKVTLN